MTEQNEYELSEQKHLHRLRSSGQNPNNRMVQLIIPGGSESIKRDNFVPDNLLLTQNVTSIKMRGKDILWTRNCIHLSTGHRLSGASTGTLWLTSTLKEPLSNMRILGIPIQISTQNSSIHMWKIQYLKNHVIHILLKSPLYPFTSSLSTNPTLPP